jgi:predicted TIM-barrel fold metal-dependent hydrolase
MGEMTYIYAGISPVDPKLDQYWALAAELDIPVMIHINRGPPAGSPSRPAGCCPDFNPDLGNPELLRPILEKYPHMRISLQHAGFPSLPELGGIDYIDETLALLRDYANVYVDMTALNSVPPAFVHESAVKQFLERGYADRIMMGTDNWEAAPIIARYENFDFLSEEQKRGILYRNAARFFQIE